MSDHSDINDPGHPGTIQRLVYRAARATTPQEWQSLNNLAHRVLEARDPATLDTTEGLLINAICAATHKVVTMQERLTVALKCLATEMVDSGTLPGGSPQPE